jgi:hypothetical protein
VAIDFREEASMRLYPWILRACVIGTLLLVSLVGAGWKWDGTLP